jgi:hypothetical protein
MSALSDFMEDALLKHIFRNTTWSRPASIYVALFTVAPSDSGGGTEVPTGGGTLYARQGLATGVGSVWDPPVVEGGGGYACKNTGDITFPVAGVAWGAIVAVALYDGNTGADNLMFWSLLTPNATIAAGDQFKILAGNLSAILR